jgi:hypothetical protein
MIWKFIGRDMEIKEKKNEEENVIVAKPEGR